MKREKLFIAFLVTTIGLSIAGCYTMLSHPTVIEDQQEAAASSPAIGEQMEIDYGHDCLQCHSGQNQMFIHRFYNHYATPVESSDNYYWDSGPREQYFYSSPWWLSDYYSGAAVPMQRESTSEEAPRPDEFSRRRPPEPTYPGSASMSSGSSFGGVSVSSGNASSSEASKEHNDSESTRRAAETKTKSSGTTESNQPAKTKTKKKAE